MLEIFTDGGIQVNCKTLIFKAQKKNNNLGFIQATLTIMTEVICGVKQKIKT